MKKKQTLKKPIYTVSKAKTLLGITAVRLYQLIAIGQRAPLPKSGLYIKTVSKEGLVDYGIEPDVIKSPLYWVSREEIIRFRGLKRR